MERTIEYKGNLIILNEDIIKFCDVRKSAKLNINKLFADFCGSINKYSNLDELCKNAYYDGVKVIKECTEYFYALIINLGVHDLTLEDFFERYCADFYTWDSDFENLYSEYIDIVLNEEQKKELRKIKAQNRGKIIGGGFGVNGAIKGMATAGAINAMTGIAAGVTNMIANAISESIADSKKEKIYKNICTKSNLYISINKNLWNISLGYAKAVDDIFQENYDFADFQTMKSIQSIVNTMDRLEDKFKTISELIEKCPFELSTYRYIIQNNYDINFELKEIIKNCYIDIYPIIQEKLCDLYANLSTKTLQQITDERNIISGYISNYGTTIEIFNPLLSSIDAYVEEQELKSRTVDGHVFDTIEEKIQYDKNMERLEGRIDAIRGEKYTLETVENLEAEIQRGEYGTFVSPTVINLVKRLRSNQAENERKYDYQNTDTIQGLDNYLLKHGTYEEGLVRKWESLLKKEVEDSIGYYDENHYQKKISLIENLKYNSEKVKKACERLKEAKELFVYTKNYIDQLLSEENENLTLEQLEQKYLKIMEADRKCQRSKSGYLEVPFKEQLKQLEAYIYEKINKIISDEDRLVIDQLKKQGVYLLDGPYCSYRGIYLFRLVISGKKTKVLFDKTGCMFFYIFCNKILIEYHKKNSSEESEVITEEETTKIDSIESIEDIIFKKKLLGYRCSIKYNNIQITTFDMDFIPNISVENVEIRQKILNTLRECLRIVKKIKNL